MVMSTKVVLKVQVSELIDHCTHDGSWLPFLLGAGPVSIERSGQGACQLKWVGEKWQFSRAERI